MIIVMRTGIIFYTYRLNNYMTIVVTVYIKQNIVAYIHRITYCFKVNACTVRVARYCSIRHHISPAISVFDIVVI